MNVAPELIQKSRQRWETEDLATNWVEEELGRYDWIDNWAKAKERGNVRERITEWLSIMHVEHDPESIISYIDGLAKARAGRWS